MHFDARLYHFNPHWDASISGAPKETHLLNCGGRLAPPHPAKRDHARSQQSKAPWLRHTRDRNPCQLEAITVADEIDGICAEDCAIGLSKAGETVCRIGEIVKGSGKVRL